ncbi:tyrosine-type recombinase/integrase [Frankia sp. EAN1pec]|uniref:tyrosine-type recombinase/integrase n=1 Tax=Parafrankia sp. (strain EAN1pec) TaxID=298653 RepID=UPI00005428E9
MAQRTRGLARRRGAGRLSTAGAHTIIITIAAAAGLDEKTTAHVLRHTFATSLVCGSTDLVTVAELLGHTRRRSL